MLEKRINIKNESYSQDYIKSWQKYHAFECQQLRAVISPRQCHINRTLPRITDIFGLDGLSRGFRPFACDKCQIWKYHAKELASDSRASNYDRSPIFIISQNAIEIGWRLVTFNGRHISCGTIDRILGVPIAIAIDSLVSYAREAVNYIFRTDGAGQLWWSLASMDGKSIVAQSTHGYRDKPSAHEAVNMMKKLSGRYRLKFDREDSN